MIENEKWSILIRKSWKQSKIFGITNYELDMLDTILKIAPKG